MTVSCANFCMYLTSQRRKELALEAEVKRREHEELEISARQDAEMKAAKARAEKEAYERVSLPGLRCRRVLAIYLILT